MHRDQMAVLVVGNSKEFDKPLSSVGPVKNIDIAIPPPPAEKGQEQNGQGQNGKNKTEPPNPRRRTPKAKR